MILVCPGCGAAASLEAWANDGDWRELVAFLPKIPAPIQGRALAYLGLWRTGKRALKAARALKILEGLKGLVDIGTVHWEGGETRPAPVELWAQALDAVIERRPQALTNHNYLKHTAWDMAAELAAEKERDHAKTRRREEENAISRGDAEIAEGSGEEQAGEREKERRVRRGCFTCASFKPPKGCGAGLRPVAGNMVMGCGQWAAKTAGVGGLMAGLAKAFTAEHAETAEEGEEE
jgi:hypothetical protein